MVESIMKERSYLTNAEAMSFGEFLHSDFRRLLKQREARSKFNQKMVDFIPWTMAMRNVTKADMRIWKKMYHDHGIRNFNNIDELLIFIEAK